MGQWGFLCPKVASPNGTGRWGQSTRVLGAVSMATGGHAGQFLVTGDLPWWLEVSEQGAGRQREPPLVQVLPTVSKFWLLFPVWRATLSSKHQLCCWPPQQGTHLPAHAAVELSSECTPKLPSSHSPPLVEHTSGLQRAATLLSPHPCR